MKQTTLEYLAASFIALGLTLAPSVKAGTTSWSLTAPTIDGADIANFTGASSEAENIGGVGGDDNYLANNRPAQGQTFLTGSDPSGYTLKAVTLQHVPFSLGYSDVYTYGTTTIRIGTVSAGVFTALTSETFAITAGNGFSSDGGGEYVTYTFVTPVALAANTTYAFDVGSDGGYYEVNGTSLSDVYADGGAYKSGVNGVGDATATDLSYDRVFHLDMSVGAPVVGSVSVSFTPPTIDGADIASFTGASSEADNIGGVGGDDNYLAANRPAQGQTFLTGSDPSGYTLKAVTLQHVPFSLGYSDDYTYGATTIRIGTNSSGVFSALAGETFAITGANGFISDGGGEYITYTFATPVSLAPNTIYAFDVASDGGYYEVNGTSLSDIYADGGAYKSGANGVGDATATDLSYDRVFHLDMSVGNTPLIITPGSVKVTGSGSSAVASLSFTNATGLNFSICATNELTAPIASWPVIGTAVETPAGSGQYEFSDPSPATNGARFYILRQP